MLEGQPLCCGAPDGAPGVRPFAGFISLTGVGAFPARPGPHVLGRSSTPDGIGRGIDLRIRLAETMADQGFAAGLLGFAPVCDPVAGGACTPPGRSCLGFSSPLSGCCAGGLPPRLRGHFHRLPLVVQLAAAHQASPLFIERTRHSPGTSAAQSVARGRHSAGDCRRLSGKQYRLTCTCLRRQRPPRGTHGATDAKPTRFASAKPLEPAPCLRFCTVRAE